MKRIDKDLLRILKSKREDELFYTIMNMGNGTYIYEIDYLNQVPKSVIRIYLEKILLVTNRKRKFNDFEDYMNSILWLCDNIRDVDYQELNKDKILSLDVYLRVKKAKSYREELKDNVVKASSFFLATIIFLSLTLPKKSNASQEILSDATQSSTTLDDIKEEEIYLDFIEPKPTENLEETEKVEHLVEEIEPTTEETDVIVTDLEKEQYILECFNLTQEEFNVVCAIVMAEAKYQSYEDAYSVINTMYNRTISKKWNRWVSSWRNDETGEIGRSLYIQATQSGQFVVYESGRYEKYLGAKEGEAYQAIIDFLYTLEIKHNFLCFRSAKTEVEGSTQFVEGGNNYFDELTDDDRIEIDLSR